MDLKYLLFICYNFFSYMNTTFREILKVVMIVLLVINSFLANSQTNSILKEKNTSLFFNKDNTLCLETSQKLSIDSLVNRKFDRLKDKTLISSSFDGYVYLKFEFQNNLSNTPLYFQFFDPHISHIEFYCWDSLANQFKSSSTAGSAYPFIDKAILHKNYIYQLPIQQKQVVYARLRSSFNATYVASVEPVDSFLNYSLVEYILLGIYYGIILLMGIYTLFLYLNTNEKLYLLYILYLFSCTLNSFTEDGLGFQFLWPSYPIINDFLMYIVPLFMLISFSIYSFQFLKLKSFSPKFSKVILAAVILYSLYWCYATFVLKIRSFNYLFLVTFLLIYINGIYTYVKGYKFARFFLLGYSMIFLAVVIYVLRINGLLPSNLFTVYSFNYGFLLELIIFSVALSDRFRSEREEKQEAQVKAIQQLKENEQLKNQLIKELHEKEQIQTTVNRELEVKVSERTIDLNSKKEELEQLNQNLSQLVERLNKMNIQLDLDNWQLKKQVQEEVKARLSDEELSPQQFNELFPDESSCLRYLEKLKWSEGYKCKKCGHDKYTTHLQPFTRKCNSCKSIESVTVDTLFQGTRIPLNKAFYIVYDTIRSGKSKTIEELAEYLELNKNTIWSFRKKVQSALELRKINNKTQSNKWDELIMTELK